MSILSSFYDASFDSISFWEQSTSGFYPDRDRTTDGDVLHTINDDNTFNDQGEGKAIFDVVVGVDGAEYINLMGKRGDAGTLSFSGGSLTATLLGISDTPGKAGEFDAYTITLHFWPGTVERADIVVQLDTATFPAHAVTDISDLVLSGDIDLSTKADNGSATVQLLSLPGAADENVRLYIYCDGTLIFNGFISGINWNDDNTVTLSCQDALAKLRHGWKGADRTYRNDGVTDFATDTSTAQNIVEAAGVDASLTHIEGEGRAIGSSQDIIIHGGEIDPLTGNPTQNDVMMDFIRLLDRSVIPNHVTYTRGNGAVYRTPRTIGGSVASFSATNAWGWQRSRDLNGIVNAWNVKGLTLPTTPPVTFQAEASAANSYLTAPWEYNGDTLDSYVIDDNTWAQDLADWLVGDTNGRLNTASCTSLMNPQTDILGSTSTLTKTERGLSSTAAYCESLHHHFDKQSFITSYTFWFRD